MEVRAPAPTDRSTNRARHAGLRSVREAIAERRAALALAAALVLLGLYPGPALVLLRDPAWRTHVIVAQLRDERAFWIAGALVIIAPAIVLANMFRRHFDRLWEAVKRRLGAVPGVWFAVGAATFAVVAAAGAGVYVLSRKPTTSDEVAQLWHARILLSGRLWLPADPNPEFFAVDNVIDDGRWYSQFPIGGPAALALAMLLRLTWLMNPVLAGLAVVNVYRFASRAYGGAEARLSAVLCATCPFLLLVSGSHMNHTLVAFLGTLALAELAAWEQAAGRRRTVASVAIGLALGTAITIRPLDGVIAALVLGGALTQLAVRRAHARSLAVAAAAGVAPVTLLLVANGVTTGHPLLFGYEVLWGENHGLGFHDSPAGNAHTPARALQLAMAYLVQLNWSLFGWPAAGLLIVAGALAVIGRFGRWETVLLLWIEAQLIAYAAYWHAGLFYGPRYLVTVVPVLLIVVARGLVLAERRASPAGGRSLVAGMSAALLSAWVIPSPPVGVLGTARALRPLRSVFKVELDPIVRALEGSKALVFVHETASTRLARRLWGLGIARPDAAQLVATRDNCALLEEAVAEAQRSGTPSERLARLARTKAYTPPPEGQPRLQAPDRSFLVSDERSVTPLCRADALLDAQRRFPIAYGLALLRNRIGADGRISGPVVFVADIGEHNEVLRERFGDRPWYRLELPNGSAGRVPRLVPYQ